MITEIKDWYIVDVYKDKLFEERIGKVLWGIVIHDEQGRFKTGDYVCTSRLLKISPEKREAYTRTGSTYLLHGSGERVGIAHDDLAIISMGVSPSELDCIKNGFD